MQPKISNNNFSKRRPKSVMPIDHLAVHEAYQATDYLKDPYN